MAQIIQLRPTAKIESKPLKDIVRRPEVKDDEEAQSMRRITESLNKINRLMAELKAKAAEGAGTDAKMP